MQNRYTGDIGDFGKLGLLRIIEAAGLTIGVNWYLTPDEKHNGDGCHIRYLELEAYRECDSFLWEKLKSIVETGEREVFAIQSESVLNATFFSVPLDFQRKAKSDRTAFRESWHKNALYNLFGLDVVFVDPDNGLIVPSAVGTAKENKYALINEIADYYRQGSSVMYYQHKARRKDSFYLDQQKRLIERPEFKGADSLTLKFITTSQRYYFFILQPKHQKIITDAVCKRITSTWGRHFCIL